ncbi:arsenic metallochaperone ArsD family protein [Serratia marcescens]
MLKMKTLTVFDPAMCCGTGVCSSDWTDPTPVDKFCPHDEACSKASGLTPPR